MANLGSNDSDGEFQALNADEGTIESVQKASHKIHAGTKEYPTIQDALDAVQTKSTDAMFSALAREEVVLPPQADDFNETVDLDTPGMALRGQYGQASYVNSDATDHVIDIRKNDIVLSYLGVNHTGTGNQDAIYVASEGEVSGTMDEVVLERCTVDQAPRYGFNIKAPYSFLVGCEGANKGDAVLHLEGDYSQVTDFKTTDPPIGMEILASYCNLSGVIWSPNIRGLTLDGNWNRFLGIIADGQNHGAVVDGDFNWIGGIFRGHDSDGLQIGGRGNTVMAVVSNNTTNGIHLTSNASDNVIRARCSDPLTIDSGATENKIVGYYTEGITDNGTRTVINGWAKNAGDPSSTGDWNGNAATAYVMGATVIDTSNEGDLYIPLPGGATNNWVRLSGTAV